MNLKNITKFILSCAQEDIEYVCKRAGITPEYFRYHIATGRKVPSEQTAAELEGAAVDLRKRKKHIAPLRCTDFIDSYRRCPHA